MQCGVTLKLVQKKAIRYFLGVHRFDPSSDITGNIGWLLGRYRRFISVLRFWTRIINMENSRLTKIVCQWGFKLKIY